MSAVSANGERYGLGYHIEDHVCASLRVSVVTRASRDIDASTLRTTDPHSALLCAHVPRVFTLLLVVWS